MLGKERSFNEGDIQVIEYLLQIITPSLYMPVSYTHLDVYKRQAYNGLQDRIRIVTGDIKEAAAVFGPASFDVVVSNPPYMTGNHGLLNAEQSREMCIRDSLSSGLSMPLQRHTGCK